MIKITTGKKFSGTMDMAFAGAAMMKNPQMINEWTKSLYANEFPFTWGLLPLLGDDVDEQVTDSNIYRIGSTGICNKTVYISNYTGTPKVDQFISITVNDGWLKRGATCSLGDGKTLLRLDDDGVTVGNQTIYRAQVVGNNPADVVPDRLLTGGSPLNFEFASYGEASTTGHPVTWETGDVYTNSTSTIRTKASWTGDFLSEGMAGSEITADVKDANGKNQVYRGFLPGDAGFYREHMASVNRALLNGKANFNPITGRIYTQTQSDEKKDVLMGSGLYETLEACAIPMAYSPKEVLDGRRQMSNILDEAIGRTALYTGQEFVGLIAITGQLGLKCTEKASQEKLIRENIQLTLSIDGENKSISTKNLYAKYQSTFGDMQFLWNKEVDNPGKKLDSQYTVSLDGTRYGLKSGDILIIPIIKYKDKTTGKMKPSLSVFSKGKTENGISINRKLVFGFFRGMTGLTNSVNTGSTFYKQLKEYAVSTTQDADASHLLSQIMLIVRNAPQCIYLKAYNL